MTNSDPADEGGPGDSGEDMGNNTNVGFSSSHPQPNLPHTLNLIPYRAWLRNNSKMPSKFRLKPSQILSKIHFVFEESDFPANGYGAPRMDYNF